MKNRNIYWRYKIQETLYIGQWWLSPLQSRHLGTSHSSPSISSTIQNTLQNALLKSPSAILLYFPESHRQSEIFFLSKVILVLGKARRHWVPNLGYRETESPGWFNVLPINSTWDRMKEWAHCHDEAASHQFSTAVANFIILLLSTDREHWGTTH